MFSPRKSKCIRGMPSDHILAEGVEGTYFPPLGRNEMGRFVYPNMQRKEWFSFFFYPSDSIEFEFLDEPETLQVKDLEKAVEAPPVVIETKQNETRPSLVDIIGGSPKSISINF